MNYYRVPTQKVVERCMCNVLESNSYDIDYLYEQIRKIHLGKKVDGHLFRWNFNGNRYYSNKDELIEFIRTGRIVDDTDTFIDVDTFLDEAMTEYLWITSETQFY